ncbi:MAG TPA: S8 family serine peptidase [Solirubrobacterales bacterium]|nr:S8 family serine peptidase [Solirubrobacterales bacterium]
MSKFPKALAVLAFVAFAAAPGALAAEPPPLLFSADRVIVEWVPGASSAERRAAREEAAVDFSRDLGSRRFQLVETEPGQTPRQAVRELEADPAVALAERDGYAVEDAVPNDPLFGQLWGLQNSGLGVNDFTGALAGADINVAGAWTRTVGTPATVVAVIDSGYRFEHPDLAGVAWTNPGETPNALDDDGNGIVDDLHGADFIGIDADEPAVDGDPTDDDLFSGGHGVHTAGTIGAEGNNGIGITGVAQDVRLMPLRVCSRFELTEDRGCPHSALVQAIEYAGAKGARVANVSLGGVNASNAVAEAIALNPQTLFVVSAGNEEQDNDGAPKYPCNYDPLGEGRSAIDNVVCVAATDQADRLASFSNWGASSVDLAAPGTETLSTHPAHAFVGDTFETDDFAVMWSAGPDGGFARTKEAPLTSFGITDSPGAPPVPNSVRASTSAPVTLPPGLQSCAVELDSRVSGGRSLLIEVFLDEEWVQTLGTIRSERFSFPLRDRLSAGGELTVRFSYDAGAAPKASAGVWVDDVEVRCIALLGEADGYRFLQGTSMATPHVTGAAALLFSQKPSATVAEVRRGLLTSVDRISALAAKTTSGGRLDAAAALDLFDAVPPPPPVLTATNPKSPSDFKQPRLIGAAQPGTEIDVYASGDCSGAPVANGTAAQLAAPGLTVTVGAAQTTQFSARATDLAPLASACSTPISYAGLDPTPDPGGGGDPAPAPDGGPAPAPGTTPAPAPVGPPPPACLVPKLAGKTLARAKAALRAAACKVGTVRKPRPRHGKRLPPLVVRSSTPGRGARPGGGEVDVVLGPKPRKAAR